MASRQQREPHMIRLVEPLFEVEALGVFPGGGEGGMQMAGEDLGIDLFEPGRHGCLIGRTRVFGR